MTDGVKDNGLTLKGQTRSCSLVVLISPLTAWLKKPVYPFRNCMQHFFIARLVRSLTIGPSLQASCSCTPCLYSEVDTRPPGPFSGGSVMTMTWSWHRNTCSPCKCRIRVEFCLLFYFLKYFSCQSMLHCSLFSHLFCLSPSRRIKIPPDCTTELNHNAYLFLQSVFDKHDKVIQWIHFVTF